MTPPMATEFPFSIAVANHHFSILQPFLLRKIIDAVDLRVAWDGRKTQKLTASKWLNLWIQKTSLYSPFRPFGMITYQQLLNEPWGLSIELSSSWWETRNLTCRWSFWWQVRSWEGIGIVDALPSNLLMAVLVPTSIPSQLPIEGAQMLLQRAGSLGTRRASPFGLKAWLLFSKCFPSTWDCKGDFKHVNVWRWIGSLSLSIYIYIYTYTNLFLS